MRRLYFDLETSPNVVYTWRIGYNLNIPHDNIIEERKIICVSYKWEGRDEVHTITWDKHQSDKSLVKDFAKVAAQADEMVGHNGDRFDIKWFRTRCLFHGVAALPKYSTVDTLKLSKSGFYFNSNRLDYLGKFFGLGGKKETGGFGLWMEVMNGSKKALKDMVTYCERDVLLLEQVHQRLMPYTAHRNHAGVLDGGYKHHCPRCGSDRTKRNKMKVTAAGTPMVQMVCKDCRDRTGKYTYWSMSEAAYKKSGQDEEKAKAMEKGMA